MKISIAIIFITFSISIVSSQMSVARIKKCQTTFRRTNGFNGKNPCRGFTALLREELGGTWVCVSGVTIGYSFTVGQFTDNSKFSFTEPNNQYKKTITYVVFQNNPKCRYGTTPKTTTTTTETTQASEDDSTTASTDEEYDSSVEGTS